MAIWVTFVLFCSFVVITVEITPNASAYTPHDPISIDGDGDFAAQAADEGWPGNGTEGNPYVIEGYEITRGHECIYLVRTRAHFIIRDSRLVSSSYNYCIFLNNVQNGSVENCILENGSFGLYMFSAGNITVTNNSVINNNIKCEWTWDCFFSENKILEGGFRFIIFTLEEWTTHTVDPSNTVNGKPVYYWKNRNGGTIPPGAGQVILANCTQVTVENQEFTNTSHGITVGHSSKNYIRGNTFHSNNEEAINLRRSTHNIISENYIYSNHHGIWLYNSDNNTIQFNNINSSGLGMLIISSNGNHIFGNKLTANLRGIEFMSSEDYLKPTINTVVNNTLRDNGIGISIDECDENTLQNNIVIDNGRGFYLSSSKRNNIIGNAIRDNGYGIYFEDLSDENSIEGNNISNNYYGFYLRITSNNRFHHNNIINNTDQLNQEHSRNIWDDGEGEGNYWDNYGGIDDGRDGRKVGDGVGDSLIPHEEVDNFPLIEPVDLERYGETEPEDEYLTDFEIVILGIMMGFAILIISIFAVILSRKKREKNKET